ncbi:MAG: LptF/LptG family permease [Kiritimatiellaeota bacterium]|nr:LptF/LptG family permease [Kiritimatiellota bacterium]
MKTIEKYVLHSFLSAFFLAWIVLSFVLTIGLLVKIADLIVRGVSVNVIGQVMLIGFPETLWLTIPLSLLVSALLVFSRLSADSEIAAMRACGVNLVSVIKYPLAFGACCTLLCCYVNNEIQPRAHEVGNNLKSNVSVDTGIQLLEAGRPNDFEKVSLFFAKKEGNWVYGLTAYDFSREVTREVTAEKALISTNGTDIVLEMYNVRIDPIDADKPGIATMGRFTHTIPDAIRHRTSTRKEKDLCFFEMLRAIKDLRANTRGMPEEYRRARLSICLTLLSKRFAEAFACICFVLVGVPLGIKAQRKDSTVGMGISLVVALTYYLIILGANELQKRPDFHPHLLVWLPVAICLALATVLLPKNL